MRGTSPIERPSTFKSTFIILTLIIYFALLAIIALPAGLESYLGIGITRNPVPLLANSDTLRAAFGAGDAGSYVLGGREIAHWGAIRSHGLVPLWPPGMFIVAAAAHLLAGTDGPVALVVVAINLAAWTTLFTLVFVYTLGVLRLSPAICFSLPLIMLLPPFFREYFLGIGMFYSESLAAATWSIGILLLLLGSSSSKLAYSILAGLALAAAAYIRAQVELTLLVTTLLAVFLSFSIVTLRFTRGESGPSGLMARLSEPDISRQIRTLMVAVAVFYAATLPYRAYNYFSYDKFSWSIGSDYYFSYLWTPPEKYTPGQKFILTGGGPIGCAVDSAKCAELQKADTKPSGAEYKELTFRTILSNPVSWISYRLSYLPAYWFSKPSITTPNGLDYLTGPIILILAISIFVSIVLMPLGKGGLVIAITWIGLSAGTSTAFMIVHYEVRYLYHLKEAIVLLSIINLARFIAPTGSAASEAIES